MLELKELYKTFNPGTINAKTALNGLSLTLNDGDFVTVIGGNGAGKSTMLNAIAGVFPVDSGSILIDGQDVTKLPEHKRAALLGRVFQDPMMGTAPTMMIEENLALAARRGQRRGLADALGHRVDAALRQGETVEHHVRDRALRRIHVLGIFAQDIFAVGLKALRHREQQPVLLLGACAADAAPGSFCAFQKFDRCHASSLFAKNLVPTRLPAATS